MWSGRPSRIRASLFHVVYFTNSITFEGSKLDINFKDSMLELFSYKESRLDIGMFEEATLAIFTKESKLDMVNYKEYKLISKLVFSFRR